MSEMYRLRIVFNAPLDREHVFYGLPVGTLDDVKEMLDDMEPVLVHAVSVQTQETYKCRDTYWRTLPASPWGWQPNPPGETEDDPPVFPYGLTLPG
jgi:hypothetical protein